MKMNQHNMKKNIVTVMALFLPFTLTFTGCKKDFIDRSDPTRLYAGDAVNSVASLNSAVTAAYGTLMPSYNNGQNGIQLFGDVASDNTTTQIGGTGSQIVDRFIFDASYIGFSQFWNSAYRSIAECNIILSRGPKITMDATLQNRYLAEAKFIRALNYFNLVRIFGDVPLITAELADYKDAYSYGRKPVADVYAQIVKDLTEASTILPATYTGADIGRVTSGAARGILGKVYLTQGKYAEALTALTSVITSNTYNLLPNFNDVFSPANEMNKEIIFAVRYARGGLGLGSSFGYSMTGGNFNNEMPEFGSLYDSSDKRKAISAVPDAVGPQYHCNKFIDPTPTSLGDYENDWIVLRYADVLLMQAEALNELNRTLEAEPYLTQVRQRAGLTPLLALSQVDFRLAVEKERRLELALEAHRWFDLVRTNRAVTVMNAHFAANAAFYGGTTYTVKPTQVLFPIPLTEIQINPKLAQNAGY